MPTDKDKFFLLNLKKKAGAMDNIKYNAVSIM